MPLILAHGCVHYRHLAISLCTFSLNLFNIHFEFFHLLVNTNKRRKWLVTRSQIGIPLVFFALSSELLARRPPEIGGDRRCQNADGVVDGWRPRCGASSTSAALLHPPPPSHLPPHHQRNHQKHKSAAV